MQIYIYKYVMFYIIYFYLIKPEKSFLFSVIIAIYNTARYLDDSIGSLISQTIGFQKIQLILINDGSTDQSEEICLKYKNIYKDNIFYLKINHSSVSHARNVGMNYATGKFINFLDSDDKWDHQAFNYFYLFFKFHPNLDIVAGRIKFFEKEINYHPLDYKFYKTRIANLNEEYNSIQLSVSSSIFRRSSLEGQYFSEEVFFCEDSRFVNNILLLKPIIGFLKEAIYYYRRRNDYSSALNNQKDNLNYYFGTLNKVSNFLINRSISIYNSIIPFIQFLIIYDLLWRIQTHAYYFLNSINLKKYKYIFEQILRKIDDKYFFEQKVASNKFKFLALSKKYNRDLRYDINLKNNSLYYLNFKILDLNSKNSIMEWRILELKNNILYLRAIDNLWLPREKYFYFIKFGSKIFYPRYSHNSGYDLKTMYGLSMKGRTFFFEISLESIKNYQILYFYISCMNEVIEMFPSFGTFSHIPPLSNGYFISENFIIKYYDKRLNVFHYKEKLEKKFENQYCQELKQIKKENIINLREIYKIRNKVKKDYEIWIINDRIDKARDNGELFFRYLNIKKPKGIKIYFAIEKNSNDYLRLKKFGNVLDLNSNQYKLAFLESNKIISSISESWVDNPFKNDKIYIRDLLHFDFIFLGQGIIYNGLSNNLNLFNKNYSLLVTSSKKEYNSILNCKFGYDKNNVIITGIPRFDYLLASEKITSKKKIIVIIPTIQDIRGRHIIDSNNFKSSNFTHIYNNLISDQQLLLILKKNKYKGFLCLNTIFESEQTDFHENEIFSIIKNCNYLTLLNASLFITDDLNIFFDMGYLKKPVIYYEPEYIKIIEEQKEIVLNYHKEGFGPVCRDLECLIKEIKNNIGNKCILTKKYIKRIKKFFIFLDNKSNERIFLHITKKKNNTKIIKNYITVIGILSIFLINFFHKFYIYIYK